MTVKVVIKPKAEADLEEIWQTISYDDPLAADRYLRRFAKRIEQLAEHPRLGPRRDDIKPLLRMLLVNPYAIFYCLLPDRDSDPVDEVEIIRIVDGRRDLTELF